MVPSNLAITKPKGSCPALATHCPGLHQVGRNIMHRFNNQDQSMMTGILTAKAILDPSTALDPWLVNQDAEYIEAGDRALRT